VKITGATFRVTEAEGTSKLRVRVRIVDGEGQAADCSAIQWEGTLWLRGKVWRKSGEARCYSVYIHLHG
jgi:hypothetical protein